MTAGAAGPVVARLRVMGFKNVVEVNFGAQAIDAHYAYRRDEIGRGMKNECSCDLGLAIDLDPGLGADLPKPILVEDLKQRVQARIQGNVMKRAPRAPGD